LLLLLFGSCPAQGTESVAETVHNLSITGPGQFKSQTDDQICVFCHTPHKANVARGLWNRRSSPVVERYRSSTADAPPGLSNASSQLCLSCHDGTVALGEINVRPRGKRDTASDLQGVFMAGRGRFGTDLSNHHPVAISYDATLLQTDPNLESPYEVDLPLPDGEMHCVSCHDPHASRNAPFLHQTTAGGELCISCHRMEGDNWSWQVSDHATSEKPPMGADPWRERKPEWKGQSVAANACMNCHAPHNASSDTRLTTEPEEQTCFRCHNGTLARNNVQAEVNKFYRHPVDRSSIGQHEPSPRENPLTAPFHVECEDCHNPHAARADLPMVSFFPGDPYNPGHTQAPLINGSLLGVSGIDISGSPVDEASYEYEVCFKCHGVPGKSACENFRCPTPESYAMTRQDGIYNLRDKVDSGNSSLVSYHPIERNNPLNDSEVPSLLVGIPLNTVDSRIYCGDCHSSSTSPAGGLNGPAGPHGSRHEGLLAYNYSLDPTNASGIRGASMCFKCHSSSNLLSDESFPHRVHVIRNRTGCVTCHDPHGSAAYPHLINFLTSASVGGEEFRITGLGGFREPIWTDNGRFSGTCYLNCHGVVHDGIEYGGGAETSLTVREIR
jgi:predicted CXXCH cytochrome family protein